MTIAEKTQTVPTWGERLKEKLGFYVSFTTAVIAAIAALTSLGMAKHGGKSTADLVRSMDQWNVYQAKSLKSYILTSETHLLAAMGKEIPAGDKAKLEELEKDKADARQKAEALTVSSQQHGALGGILAKAVMLFQIAIANAAIASLSKRPGFWLVSVGLALVGIAFVAFYWVQPVPLPIP